MTDQVHVPDFEGAPAGATAHVDAAAGELVITPQLGGGPAGPETHKRFPLDAVPDWVIDRYDGIRGLLMRHLGGGAAPAAEEEQAALPAPDAETEESSTPAEEG